MVTFDFNFCLSVTELLGLVSVKSWWLDVWSKNLSADLLILLPTQSPVNKHHLETPSLPPLHAGWDYLLDVHQSGQSVSASGFKSPPCVCECQAQWHLSHFRSVTTPSSLPRVSAWHFAGVERDRVLDSVWRCRHAPLSFVSVCLVPSKKRFTLRTEGESVKQESFCAICDYSQFDVWLDFMWSDVLTVLLRKRAKLNEWEP